MSYFERADLYALLAETFSEPPEWMSLSGREWPLFETVAGIASKFELAHRYLDLLACIPPEELDLRRERYTAIFASNKPRFWLYESAALTGKILGSQTFEIARLYRAAGLEIVGAELPDHISLELAFLSHLAGSSQERQFLEGHASWMIDLGHALSYSDDEVYALIGALLSDWLEYALVKTSRHKKDEKCIRVPTLPQPDNCTLCGFCVQVCPTRALKMLEDSKNTLLVFDVAECIHCSRCEKICEFHALKMGLPTANQASPQILLQSLLFKCQRCRRPVASQVEMNYIVSQVGEATWLNLCLDCRPRYF